jgi:hypothetical protein
MTPRRFPPPWTVIEHAESFWVQDAGGQTVGGSTSATTKTARQAKVPTRDEARRIGGVLTVAGPLPAARARAWREGYAFGPVIGISRNWLGIHSLISPRCI